MQFYTDLLCRSPLFLKVTEFNGVSVPRDGYRSLPLGTFVSPTTEGRVVVDLRVGGHGPKRNVHLGPGS